MEVTTANNVHRDRIKRFVKKSNKINNCGFKNQKHNEKEQTLVIKYFYFVLILKKIQENIHIKKKSKNQKLRW